MCREEAIWLPEVAGKGFTPFEAVKSGGRGRIENGGGRKEVGCEQMRTINFGAVQ